MSTPRPEPRVRKRAPRGRRRRRLVRLSAVGVALATLVAFWGCVGPIKGLYPPEAGAPVKTVHVISNGFHAGLVLRTSDVPKGLWPEKADQGDARFLEVGWGDEGFYRAEEATCGVALRAACWPTPSVLHVVGFSRDLENVYPGLDLLRVDLSEKGFARMCETIDGTFYRGDGDRAAALSEGLYANSHFYRAKGKYYAPKSCNCWTAKCLRRAGCPIRPSLSITAGSIVRRVRRFGETIHARN